MIVDSICNLAPGSYDITINSASGCPRDTTIIIAGSSTFTVIETIAPATCGASDGSISVSITNGSAPFSFSWSAGGSNGNSLTNLASGNYSVTITDQNGCSVTESYLVPQNNFFGINVFPISSTLDLIVLVWVVICFNMSSFRVLKNNNNSFLEVLIKEFIPVVP
jgi:hypothetical protein